MATLREISSKVMNYLRGGFQVDDNKIDWELIYDEVRKQRMNVLHEEFLRNKTVDAQFYQYVRCLKINCRDIICDGIDSGDDEQYITLPGIAIANGKSLIRYLGTSDFKTPWSEKSVLNMIYKDADLYGKKKDKTFYMRIDKEAILENVPCGMEFAGLIAVLEDPIKTGCVELSLDEDYPIPGHLIARTEYFCINVLLGMLNLDPEQLNNAKDELSSNYRQPSNRNRN